MKTRFLGSAYQVWLDTGPDTGFIAYLPAARHACRFRSPAALSSSPVYEQPQNRKPSRADQLLRTSIVSMAEAGWPIVMMYGM